MNLSDRHLLPEWDEKINELVSTLLDATKIAGDKILQFYTTWFSVEHKNNDVLDPVTQADMASDTYLRRVVRSLFPNDEILSEEHEEKDVDYTQSVWMIDPLDGTKDFIYGGKNFSVMIGRCEAGSPTLWVIYLPLEKVWYYAVKWLWAYKTDGFTSTKLKVSDTDQIHGAKFFGKGQFSESRPIEDAMKSALGIDTFLTGGSIGIISCSIAEWIWDACIFTSSKAGKRDVCASQIILQEAGGVMTEASGNPLDFAWPGYRLKNYLIVSNGKLHKEIIQVSKTIYGKAK